MFSMLSVLFIARGAYNFVLNVFITHCSRCSGVQVFTISVGVLSVLLNVLAVLCVAR